MRFLIPKGVWNVKRKPNMAPWALQYSIRLRLNTSGQLSGTDV